MVILFWIFTALASLFLIAFIIGLCCKKFIFASCMNIGLAICAFILNLINIGIKHL